MEIMSVGCDAAVHPPSKYSCLYFYNKSSSVFWKKPPNRIRLHLFVSWNEMWWIEGSDWLLKYFSCIFNMLSHRWRLQLLLHNMWTKCSQDRVTTVKNQGLNRVSFVSTCCLCDTLTTHFCLCAYFLLTCNIYFIYCVYTNMCRIFKIIKHIFFGYNSENLILKTLLVHASTVLMHKRLYVKSCVILCRWMLWFSYL